MDDLIGTIVAEYESSIPSGEQLDMKIFIGTGVQGLQPEGFTTADINPDNHPDIVANAANLPMIANEAVDVFHASHVLEHFSWPRALLVLNEWARVLKVGGQIKIAVPDMSVYAHFLLNGHNTFNVMQDIHGGHWYAEGGPQGHHFGYTRRMLLQVLTIMGFAEFSGWKSDMPEASNTWAYGENQERVVISLNIAGTKVTAPLLDVPALYHEICHHNIRESFMVVVRNKLLAAGKTVNVEDIDSMLFQKLNFQYMEALHMADVYKKKATELKQSMSHPNLNDQ